MLGLAEGAFAGAVFICKQREQFGKPYPHFRAYSLNWLKLATQN